jgi:hypothetical protein
MRTHSSKATAWRTTDATGFPSRPASGPPSGTTPSGAMLATRCLSPCPRMPRPTTTRSKPISGHRLFPQLRLAFRGGGCQEQRRVRQHNRHAELHVCDRLQIHLVHLRTADAVSEWLEEPDLLEQHLPCAVTRFYSVLSLGRLEKFESVAGNGAGCRRQHILVGAEVCHLMASTFRLISRPASLSMCGMYACE